MNAEPSIETLIISKIDTLDKSLNKRLDDQATEVNRRFTDQDKTLLEIRTQTLKTNGRVTVLEKARERAQGVIFAFSWAPAVLSGTFSAGITILILAVTGGLK